MRKGVEGLTSNFSILGHILTAVDDATFGHLTSKFGAPHIRLVWSQMPSPGHVILIELIFLDKLKILHDAFCKKRVNDKYR